MRRLEFAEPNFICKVKDSEGKDYKRWLFCFDSKEELAKYLEERSYKLVSARPYKFEKWLKRAEDAAKLANEAKNKEGFKYDQALWGLLKQYLFTLSNGKCGYCEVNVLAVYSGDVEHYRPKKKVTEDPAHPGYYWLAYDPTNYVPVCQNCNGARAKANHFPLEAGSPRAYSPADDITKERPLLINPIGKEDPAQHLTFVGPEGGKDDFGKIKGITPAGEASRQIYHLNRPELIGLRRIAYKTWTDNKPVLEAQWESVSQQMISHLRTGFQEFTLVIKSVVTTWLQEIKIKKQQSSADAIKAYKAQIAQEELRQQALEAQIDNDLLMLTR